MELEKLNMSKKQLIMIGLILFGLTFIFTQNRAKHNNSRERALSTYSQIESNFDKQKSALEAARYICKNIETNNIEALKSFVVEVPDVYIQKSEDLMRRHLRMDEETYQRTIQEENNTFTISPYPVPANKEETVYTAIPIIAPIQEQKRKFVEVIDFKQYENQAKAIVIFGNGQIPDSKYEILLFRDNDGWKTFRVTYPSKLSATYAEKTQ